MKIKIVLLGIVIWLFFHTVSGLSFDIKRCIEEARTNNPDLAEVRQSVKKAKAQIAISESDLWPSIDFNAWAKFVSVVPEMEQKETILETPVGEITIPGKTSRLGDYDSYSMDLEIKQIFYAGGRLKGAVDQARYQMDVAEGALPISRARLDGNVGITYLVLARMTLLHKVAEESLKLTQHHLEDILNLKTEGSVTSNEVLKAEIRVSEARTSVLEIGNSIEKLVEKLRLLTGWTFELPEVMISPDYSERDLPDLKISKTTAFQDRPELLWIDTQIKAAEHQQELIHLSKMPVVSAFGRISYGKPGPNFVKNEWIDSYHAGIQCSVNIWDFERISNREYLALEEVERLKLKRKALESTIEMEVIESILAIKDSRQRLEIARQTQEQAEENFRITSNQFQEGTLTNTDYLDAEIALSKARIDTVVVKTQLDQAWISYFLSIGTDLAQEAL